MKLEDLNDPVNQPAHYRQHPSGIECIEITRHMNFNLGNATRQAADSVLEVLHEAIGTDDV